LIKKLGWSRILVPILSGLGFLGSGIQTFRLIQKMRRLSPK
jgi:hypothetical protein